MDVWGLTGLMGSGKSFARERLAKKGFPCLDADQVAAQLWKPRENIHLLPQERWDLFLSGMKNHFSDAVDLKNVSMDKNKVQDSLRHDSSKRMALESVFIPQISYVIREKIKTWAQDQHRVVFVEGTRLAESTLRKDILKGIVFVQASEELRRQRIQKRNPDNFQFLLELEKSQNETFMKSVSEVVWVNESTEQEFENQIDQFLKLHGYGN